MARENERRRPNQNQGLMGKVRDFKTYVFGESPDPEETARLREIEQLKREFDTEQVALGKAQSLQVAYQESLSSAQVRSAELQTALDKLKKERKIVEEDLAATMQQAPDEGRIDAGEGIKRFIGLIQSITDTADKIFGGLGKLLNARFNANQYNRFLATLQKDVSSPDLHNFLYYFRNQKSDLAMGAIAYVMLHHILSHGIQASVFGVGFLPGRTEDDPEVKILSEIHSSIHKKESQGDRLRWKALTLKYARAKEDWTPTASRIASDINTVAREIAQVEMARDGMEAAIRVLLEEAASLRNLLEQECVDGDFEVFMQPSDSQKLNPKHVEILAMSDRAKGDVSCFLGTAWGVQCLQTTQRNGKETLVCIDWIPPTIFAAQSSRSSMLAKFREGSLS